jgi:hypothetical protein
MILVVVVGEGGAMRWFWIVILVPTAMLACGF